MVFRKETDSGSGGYQQLPILPKLCGYGARDLADAKPRL